MKPMPLILVVLVVAAAAGAFYWYQEEQKGPLEKAGERLDQSLEGLKNEVENLGN